MKPFLYLFLLILCFCQCKPKTQQPDKTITAKPAVPPIILKEHSDILTKMDSLAQRTDSAGSIARKLLDLARYHFKEEEDYVFPPLGLLASIKDGALPSETNVINQLTDRFRSEYNKLLAEHQMIIAHIKEIETVLPTIESTSFTLLKKELEMHAQREEEVFFPAVILMDDYLKLKTSNK